MVATFLFVNHNNNNQHNASPCVCLCPFAAAIHRGLVSDLAGVVMQEALAKCEHDVAAAEVARETAAKAQAIAEQELKETRDRHAHSHSTHRQTQSEQEETIERLRTEIAEVRIFIAVRWLA